MNGTVREDGEQVVAVLARGDREINETKLLNHLGAINVTLADEKLVRGVTGAAVGFAGPIGLTDEVQLLADKSVEGVKGFLCGGNETDTHYLDVYFGRDLEMPPTVELGTVQAGDRTVDGEGEITTIAGNGQAGFSGDGGPAAEASLNLPSAATAIGKHRARYPEISATTLISSI